MTAHPARAPRIPVALAAGVLLATGCANVHRVGMHESERNRLGAEVQKVSTLQMQEVGTTIKRASGGQAFGLIGALVDSAVDSSRTTDAETQAVVVRNALLGHDTAGALRAALDKELAGVSFLGQGAVEAQTIRDPDTLRAFVAKSGRPVLLVETYYRLSPLFDSITVSADVHLLPAKIPAAAKPTDAALYRNSLFSVVSMPTGVVAKTREENARIWAADEGKLAKVALDRGIEDLSRLVAFDVGEPTPAGGETYEAPARAKREAVFHPETELSDTGYQVKKENGRTWVRLRNGVIYSLGKLPAAAP